MSTNVQLAAISRSESSPTVRWMRGQPACWSVSTFSSAAARKNSAPAEKRHENTDRLPRRVPSRNAIRPVSGMAAKADQATTGRKQPEPGCSGPEHAPDRRARHDRWNALVQPAEQDPAPATLQVEPGIHSDHKIMLGARAGTGHRSGGRSLLALPRADAVRPLAGTGSGYPADGLIEEPGGGPPGSSMASGEGSRGWLCAALSGRRRR
jgi:hypothetical protein